MTDSHDHAPAPSGSYVSIGKEIGMVRLNFAEDPHDLVQDCFRSLTHLQRPR